MANSGIAPASAPARRSSRNCGSQPLRALAQPVSISAERNSWRTKGCAPASAFHSCGSHAGEGVDDLDTLSKRP